MAALFDVIRKEWGALKQAPWSFASLTIAAFVFAYAACNLIYPLQHPTKPCSVAPPCPASTLPPASHLAHRQPALRDRGGRDQIFVGKVTSTNQTGGVTAGNVGDVNLGGPK